MPVDRPRGDTGRYVARGTPQAKESPLYAIWKQMRYRCSNPSHPDFRDYGARGITVCDRWQRDFLAFCQDMGPRPQGTSLDRRDNDGPYSPENCRWATPLEQSNNSRKNRFIEACGERLTVSQWARRLGWSREQVAALVEQPECLEIAELIRRDERTSI